MGIRVQPKEIEIPEGDPFKNDLLGRKEPIEILTRLVGTIEGPCVMAVDALWGSGKTTFIKLWHQYLLNNNLDVVRFNAWENDFCNDPFVALLGELTSSSELQKSDKFKKFKEAGIRCAQYFVSNAVTQMTAGIMNPSKLAESLKEKPSEKETDRRLEVYKDAKGAMEEFKEALKSMVSPTGDETGKKDANEKSPQETAASNEKQRGPLIVIIEALKSMVSPTGDETGKKDANEKITPRNCGIK